MNFTLVTQCIPALLELTIKGRPRIFLRIVLITRTQIQLCESYTTLRPSIAHAKSDGILTVCPSGSVLTIPLGPTNPWLIYIAKETLIFRR